MRQDQQLFASFLKDPDAIGSVLLIGLLDEFGTEMLDWEPETLRQEVRQTWNTTVPTRNWDKIWALATVLTTDNFYSSLDGFIHICNALSSHGADFQRFDPATIQEICWALAEVQMLNPPEKDDVFNDEIRAYMKARLDEEGFLKAPQLMRPYVPDQAEESVEDTLAMDGIDYNGFWDKQQRDRLEIDEYVRRRLFTLVQGIAALPLRNSDRKAVQDLQQRVSKALAVQLQETEQASGSVSPVPNL